MWRTLLASTLAAACAPRYGALPAMSPDELWAPLPVEHVTVRGVDVAYVDSGGSGDPIVFVHGLSSYLSFWEYQIPYFARGHRVLALDLPGYGQSGRPDAPCTPPWYADVVSDWMGTLGVDHATVVGHSMGGQVAVHLALSHPARVDRLVLSAPAGFERFTAGAGRFMREFWTESRAGEATEEQVRANFTAMVFNRGDEGVERLIRERVQLGKHPRFQGTSVAVSRSIAGMLDHPVLERAKDVRVPVLVVYGTDDRMIPNPVFTGGRTRAVAEAAVNAFPDARLVLVPGAGHTVHHDAPDAFNEAMEEFLP
jgi:pimeloyl-ACP methyl ester carboxylesterase